MVAMLNQIGISVENINLNESIVNNPSIKHHTALVRLFGIQNCIYCTEVPKKVSEVEIVISNKVEIENKKDGQMNE